MTQKTYRDLFLLFLFVFLSHFLFFAFKESTLFVDQDQWIYSEHAIEWAKGIRFSFFPSGLDYSGVGVVDLVRIFLTTLTNAVTSNDLVLWEYLQLVVSFLVSPFLMACAVYYFITAYYKNLSVLSLFLIGMGFPFQIFIHGVDPYLHAVIFIFFALGLRARYEDIFSDFKVRNLVFLGIASGFSTSVLRSSFLVVPLFFISNQNIADCFKAFSKPKTPFLKNLKFTIMGLVAFGVALALVGGSKMFDTYPNFKYAFYISVIYLISSGVFNDCLDLIKYYGVFILGFICGFIPEFFEKVVYKLPWMKTPGSKTGELNLHSFLRALREFIVGLDYNPHLLSVFYLVFFGGVAALFCFFLFQKKSELKQKKISYLLPLFILLMNFSAFFQIAYSNPGSARYLIGFFPFLYLAFICLLEDSFWKKQRLVISGALCLLFGIFLFQKIEVWKKYYNPKQYEALHALVLKLRNQKIHYVLSEDFKMSTVYSSFARGNPWFVSGSYLRVPKITDDTIQSEDRIASCTPFAEKYKRGSIVNAFSTSWIAESELIDDSFTRCWLLRKLKKS